MRNTWAAYMVDIETGKIEWTLGGKHSSFKFGPGAAFQWQHDVGARPQLDDQRVRRPLLPAHRRRHLRSPDGPIARARAELDQQTHTATLAAQYVRGQKFDADYMGDTEPLPDGNVFVGWGSEPYLSEYSRSGQLLFEGELPGPDVTYRAMIEPWVGLPLSRPAGAVRESGRNTTVYASWNGATSSPPGRSSRRGARGH